MSKGNVVLFTGITRHNLPADRVVESIPKDMTDVVVIGYDADGEFYFASSVADGPEVLWRLEQAKLALLRIEADSRGDQ